jgi:hypothetical protein
MVAAVDSAIPTIQQPPLTFNSLFEPLRTSEQGNLYLATIHHVSDVPLAESLSNAARWIKPAQLVGAQVDRRNRLFDRLIAQAPEKSDDGIDFNSQDPEEQAIFEECRSRSIGLSLTSSQAIRAFLSHERMIRSLDDPTQFAAEQERLIEELDTTRKLLYDPPEGAEGLGDRNRAILLSLRSVCASPLYDALRCTNGHPFTDLVHSLVLRQYTNTDMQQNFERLGQQLNAEKKPLSQRVQMTWDRLSKAGMGPTAWTSLVHYKFTQILGIVVSFIAAKIARLFSLSWLAKWAGDERTIGGNTPDVIFEERKGAWTVRTVALAAPTLAVGPSPEFRAVLQALENNQYGHNDDFVSWSYTNLQNLFQRSEHESSTTLSALAVEFPLSFRSITLPQFVSPAPQVEFSEHDVQHHLSLIFNPLTTQPASLRRSSPEDVGYYFPPAFLKK